VGTEYVVLSYEARGWDGSGEVIGMAGPEDVMDAHAAVDMLGSKVAEWVNTSAIAAAVVSYGAGIAVLAAAADPRIKVALSMSGWGNLTTAFYGGDTPALVWGSILVDSGKLDGHEPPILIERWHELLEHKNISQVSAWSNNRSAMHYLDQLCGNGRATPVFVSNNLEDRLFKPDAAVFYSRALCAGPPRSPCILLRRRCRLKTGPFSRW
jgi:hypothetical protein